MTRRTQAFYSMNTGELDPKLIERADVKHYHSALKRGKNLLGSPQGGASNKVGSRHRAILRRQMVAQSLAAATAAAPNGGTAANAKDGDPATTLVTNAITPAATFVALTLDFGQAVVLAAFDVAGVKCATLSAAGVLKVQSSTDAVAYTDFGGAHPLSTTSRTLRFALPPRQTRSARYWRVVVSQAPAGLGALTLANVLAYTAGAVSAIKLIEMNVNPAAIYTLALTGGNADIFEGGTWRGAAALPYSSTQLGAVNFTQSVDTLLLFHPDAPTHRLLRLGLAASWDSGAAIFLNVPRYDFGDTTYTNGIDEEQLFVATGLAESVQVVLTCEGYTTEPFNYSATMDTWIARVKAALEALPNVDAGLTVTQASSSNNGIGGENNIAGGVRVKFSGGRNAARPWLEMVPRIVMNETGSAATDNTVTCSRVVKGRKGGEDLWSATRGYPRHGVIFQQRLILGGFRSAGNVIGASRTGELFDFDIFFEAASGAYLDPLDADDDRTVMRFHIGRNLQIFTNTSAHFCSSRELSRDTPRNYVQSARAGIVEGSRSVDLQGATIFLEAGGEVLREFLFNQTEDNYGAANLSILSSHLVAGALDLAVRRSASSSDADLIFIPRANGDLTVVTALRAEEVTGIYWWSGASGAYRSVAVDGAGLVHFARERTIAGTAEIVLETADDSLVMDDVITATPVGPVPATVFNGLDDQEGLSVWVYADGSPVGPLTVTGGSITLPEAASSALVGVWDPPEGETLPLRPDDSEAVPVRKKRIFKVRASLYQSGNLAIGANGRPPREVALWGFDNLLDVALLDRLVSTEVEVGGLMGWTYDGTVVFTQTAPAPLTLRGLRCEYDG